MSAPAPALLMMEGGIPLSVEGRASAYLSKINGKARTYTATYETAREVADRYGAWLEGIGYRLDGFEIEFTTAGPRYERDRGMHGTWFRLRHDGTEWRLVEAEKVRVFGYAPEAVRITRPNGGIINPKLH